MIAGDEAGGEGRDSEMEVDAAFVARGQISGAFEPGKDSFDDPSVTPKLFAALDLASGDPRGAAATLAVPLTAAMIVSLVGVQLVRSATGMSPPPRTHARHGVERGAWRAAVVAVGPRECQAERRATGIGHEVVLGTRLAAGRWVQADRCAPCSARTLARLSAARDQSKASAS